MSLKSAIHIGISISEYNEMTPHELNLHILAYAEKQRQDMEEKVALARLGEYLHRVKKLPSVDELLKQPKRQMTDEEMYEQVKKLNALFGGEVK